jgi:signal transduction histidine kinase
MRPATDRSDLAVERLSFPPPLLSLVLLALYVGLEWLSFLHEHNNLPVTPWNPGLGMMFAMIVLRGLPMGIVLFLGVVLAQLTVVRGELPLAATLLMGALIAGTYTAVALLVRRRLELASELLRTRDVLLLTVAGLGGALAVSIQLGLLLLSVKHFQPGDIATTSLPLIVGDVIGIAVVTPLILRVALHGSRPLVIPGKIVVEFAAFILVNALILLLVVRPPGYPGQSLFYLLFVPVVIAAVRHGIDGACAALALAQLGLVAFLHWHGFDINRFTEYQVMMLVLTVTGLTVGGLVSERQAADRATEAARHQLEKMEEKAARAARLNLASGMAAALAHEINQPMTAARALARSVQELIRMPNADYARIQRNLTTMIEQIDHAGAVVSRMREFLRRGEPHVSTLEIGRVLGEAITLAEPLLRSRQVRLQLDVPDTLPVVHGDRVQIGQVILNLVKNSVDAIAEGADGVIRVTARDVPNEKSIEVAVVDNGQGVPADQVEALFEPLNTSRPDGIGLGLWICRTILQSHGGRIWLSSSVPGRTEFRFALPAIATHPGR